MSPFREHLGLHISKYFEQLLNESCGKSYRPGNALSLSGEDRSAARVFKANPRLNHTRQINSFSRGVNCDSGPFIDFVASTDSPKFQ